VSGRGFIILLVCLGLLFAAVKSPLAPMVGFFAGWGFLMMIAGPAMVALNGNIELAMWIFGSVWAALIGFLLYRCVRLSLVGDGQAALGRFATALTMVLVPVAFWMSTVALQDAWPGGM
jgi:hypothetical protein